MRNYSKYVKTLNEIDETGPYHTKEYVYILRSGVPNALRYSVTNGETPMSDKTWPLPRYLRRTHPFQLIAIRSSSQLKVQQSCPNLVHANDFSP